MRWLSLRGWAHARAQVAPVASDQTADALFRELDERIGTDLVRSGAASETPKMANANLPPFPASLPDPPLEPMMRYWGRSPM